MTAITAPYSDSNTVFVRIGEIFADATRPGLRLAAMAGLAALCTASTEKPAEAGVTVGMTGPAIIETVAVDWQTGYAINGFDPVAYFIDGAAIQGKPDYEAQWKGAVWMFRNAGNRDAFVAAPHVYAPLHGGHDPEMAARGHIAHGNPLHWTIEGGKLRLFRSPTTRRAFAQR